MKKVLSFTIVLALVLALAAPAFAVSTNTSTVNGITNVVISDKGVVLFEGSYVGKADVKTVSVNGATIVYINGEQVYPHVCKNFEFISTATCTAGGSDIEVCTDCGKATGVTGGWLGALGHDYDFSARKFINASWDEVTCLRCGDTIATASIALIEAREHLEDWVANAKVLSQMFEAAGIYYNNGNVALMNATEYADFVLGYAAGLEVVQVATNDLKDAYWAALEAYNLVFAAVELGNWINYASDRIDYLKDEGLWNTDPTQVLYYYMVEYYHNVYLPAYNWNVGTSEEVLTALQTLKDAFWATYQ